MSQKSEWYLDFILIYFQTLLFKPFNFTEVKLETMPNNNSNKKLVKFNSLISKLKPSQLSIIKF